MKIISLWLVFLRLGSLPQIYKQALTWVKYSLNMIFSTSDEDDIHDDLKYEYNAVHYINTKDESKVLFRMT